MQEEVCEENFWKACKITFKEQAYNYTLETCTTPLVKQCDEQPRQQRQQESYGAPARKPETVCKIWFESECNTTFSQVGKPRTSMILVKISIPIEPLFSPRSMRRRSRGRGATKSRGRYARRKTATWSRARRNAARSCCTRR